MSKTISQIYGVLTVADAELCRDLGAEYIGMVFAEEVKSPHAMTPKQLGEYFAACPAELTKVGLTHLDDIEHVLKLLDIYCPPVLHLVGDQNYMTPDMVLRIKQAHPEVKIMMAIAIDVAWTLENDLAEIRAFLDKYAPVSDYFLLDTGKKADGSLGATGATHDWNIDRYIVENAPNVKVIIAGGLDADNVAEAIRVAKPYGVDTFTRTSYPKGTTGPGGNGKDPEKLRAFITAVKNA